MDLHSTTTFLFLILTVSSVYLRVSGDGCNEVGLLKVVQDLQNQRSPKKAFNMFQDLDKFCTKYETAAREAKDKTSDCDVSNVNDKLKEHVEFLEWFLNAVTKMCSPSFKAKIKTQSGCLNKQSKEFKKCDNSTLVDVKFNQNLPSEEICCGFEEYRQCIAVVALDKCGSDAESVVKDTFDLILKDQIRNYCEATSCPNSGVSELLPALLAVIASTTLCVMLMS